MLDATVCIREPPWTGATTLVVRRIAMDLDTWATLTRGPRARARLAHPMENAGARVVRKGVSYATPDDSGLVFLGFQASVVGQFVPIQRSLDRADAPNTFTTAIGSAQFVVLPGFDRGDWLGSTVLGGARASAPPGGEPAGRSVGLR